MEFRRQLPKQMAKIVFMAWDSSTAKEEVTLAFRVHVKGRKPFYLRVGPKDLVADVRAKVEAHFGIAHDQFKEVRLHHGERELADDELMWQSVAVSDIVSAVGLRLGEWILEIDDSKQVNLTAVVSSSALKAITELKQTLEAEPVDEPAMLAAIEFLCNCSFARLRRVSRDGLLELMRLNLRRSAQTYKPDEAITASIDRLEAVFEHLARALGSFPDAEAHIASLGPQAESGNPEAACLVACMAAHLREASVDTRTRSQTIRRQAVASLQQHRHIPIYLGYRIQALKYLGNACDARFLQQMAAQADMLEMHRSMASNAARRILSREASEDTQQVESGGCRISSQPM